jgi:guanylate kinase
MESLEARLRGRGTDSEDRIQLRLLNARREMELVKEYDYAVVNEVLATAQRQVASIIVSESLRVARRAARGAA